MAASPVVVWFRRDLRLHDHPALAAASHEGRAVAPLFVLDDGLLHGRWPSANRTAFLLGSLSALGDELRRRGAPLTVLRGNPARVVPAFAHSLRASEVYVTRDYGPYARSRDRAVGHALAADGARLVEFPGLLAREPEQVLKDDGTAYRVYTPFLRRWLEAPARSVVPAPANLTPVDGTGGGPLPSLAELGFAPPSAHLPAAGERAARERLRQWAAGPIDAYANRRDLLAAEDGTSRLSQDLHFGLLSPIEVIEACGGPGAGRQKFGSELAWREFYTHLLWWYPGLLGAPLDTRFEAMPWRHGPGEFDAWRRGETGYPVVDAAMRQLLATGYMHNRARMVAASFLAKDLLLDWRLGESHFMAHLVDGDVANNDGGWQWAAGCGADAQPFFRIFNPVLQGKKFDPEGVYVRRWLPELARVPTRFVHSPWMMPGEVQEEAACRLGHDYPAPMVDHSAARERALAVFRQHIR